jgi:hypothetical protein
LDDGASDDYWKRSNCNRRRVARTSEHHAIVGCNARGGVCVALRGRVHIDEGARIYASDAGLQGFNVSLNDGDRAPARLFRFDLRGKEKTVWTAKLVTLPTKVYVADDGPMVVAPSRPGRAEPLLKHAVVVYGSKGTVLANYRLSDLLNEQELNGQASRRRPPGCGLRMRGSGSITKRNSLSLRLPGVVRSASTPRRVASHPYMSSPDASSKRSPPTSKMLSELRIGTTTAPRQGALCRPLFRSHTPSEHPQPFSNSERYWGVREWG